MNTVRVECYLIIKARFSRSGILDGKPQMRVTKHRPAVEADEVPLFLNLSLPKSLFQRPVLEARIDVPGADYPMEISPEMQVNLAQQIQEMLGATVNLTVTSGADEHDRT